MNISRLFLDDGVLAAPEFSSPRLSSAQAGNTGVLQRDYLPLLRVLPPPIVESNPLSLLDPALRRQRNWEAAVFFLMAACGLAGILGAFVAAFAGLAR